MIGPLVGEYLTSALGPGLSNGLGTAAEASFCASGMGEETWSSRHAPASHNALVACTPSRGVISVPDNWPLVPTMGVGAPQTRTIGDLQHVLDAVVTDDPEIEGDLQRTQPFIELPRPSEVCPLQSGRVLDDDLFAWFCATGRLADARAQFAAARERFGTQDRWPRLAANFDETAQKYGVALS
ncbi:hypothetical protein [Microbacterium trichothecenolyticum]|uniref:Asp-tRNA(Asn)/Glu-tRNA(Gln) amidotransferase A subunit family amidase n=1 Tax=Microbacterium trichothecenolyticum TaxID=69370 RepID=A0ABU0TUY7_MICTR|nr:hypothetical protein [Microbacterium trichothecenolyticum]MDQ1123478.1 Asp-tRNA(Asn)/Glu-tRNA(Gln) amidotransferase A subunit family amidase [Microbacterium trichothecenolyticum]